MIKGSICQEEVLILNVYELNNRASIYMKQKVMKLKGDVTRSKITVKDFKTPVPVTNRVTGKKISKEIDLNRVINQKDAVDMYRTLHETTAEHIIFQVPMEHSSK